MLFGLALAKFGENGPPVVFERSIDHQQPCLLHHHRLDDEAGTAGARSARWPTSSASTASRRSASYGKLIAACYLAARRCSSWSSPAIVKFFAGVNLWKFLVYIKDELFLALGTASTEVVLPRIMDKLIYAGCSRTTTGLVVPTGYSFNLDGATLYLSICVLFLAQALGVDLSLGEQITAVLVLMLTSKGMAGVPGSSFLALSATVAAIGHGAIPVAAVALLLGADRIMDSMRVSVNLLGNCVATFVVARWEGQLDYDRMRKVLRGDEIDEVDDELVETESVSAR